MIVPTEETVNISLSIPSGPCSGRPPEPTPEQDGYQAMASSEPFENPQVSVCIVERPSGSVTSPSGRRRGCCGGCRGGGWSGKHLRLREAHKLIGKWRLVDHMAFAPRSFTYRLVFFFFSLYSVLVSFIAGVDLCVRAAGGHFVHPQVKSLLDIIDYCFLILFWVDKAIELWWSFSGRLCFPAKPRVRKAYQVRLAAATEAANEEAHSACEAAAAAEAAAEYARSLRRSTSESNSEPVAQLECSEAEAEIAYQEALQDSNDQLPEEAEAVKAKEYAELCVQRARNVYIPPPPPRHVAGIKGLVYYLFRYLNIVDIIAIIPIQIPFYRMLRIFAAVKLFALCAEDIRLTRCSSVNEVSQLQVANGIAKLTGGFVVLVSMCFVVIPCMILTNELQYEGQNPGVTTIHSAADVLYYTVTVASTVGFGDLSTHSSVGRALTIVLEVVGVSLIGSIGGLISSKLTTSLTEMSKINEQIRERNAALEAAATESQSELDLRATLAHDILVNHAPAEAPVHHEPAAADVAGGAPTSADLHELMQQLRIMNHELKTLRHEVASMHSM